MDLSTIPAALSSIKTATDIAKLIKDSGLSLKEAEIKLKLSEIISELADANTKIAEIQRQMIEKENEIDKLKNKIKLKGKMIFESPYYWKVEGNKKDGPFCQHCYDKDNILIRLQGNGGGFWECKACKNTDQDSTYKPPQILTSRRKSITDDF